MWAEIIDKVASGDYPSARELLEKEKRENTELDDVFWVLDATVCQAEEKFGGMYQAMKQGLACNPDNYELYYMLACYYMQKNVDQAYLCLENALHFCQHKSDQETLQRELLKLQREYTISVRPTAIIIVTYNLKQLQIRNIESIRRTLPSNSYRIIAVDNASMDGTTEWLSEQEDIILVKNRQNMGFSVACNQGASKARETGLTDYNIFLLNNDTQLCANSLFWLRMGLYENPLTGATGAISNYAGNQQQIEQQFDTLQEYLAYGKKNNVPMDHPYEERVRLSGFAMLVRSEVWDAVGGMDEDFVPGYFEDDALCMEILRRGYRNVVCKNSFIYHAGSQSFAKKEGTEQLLLSHHNLFQKKYQFDILEYAYPNEQLADDVLENCRTEECILQIGAGLGADLKYLRSNREDIVLYGIEKKLPLQRLAKETEKIFSDFDSLCKQLSDDKINLLIANEEQLQELTVQERELLAGICHRTCKIISGDCPYHDFPFSKIKLVIWDMDDTFWEGTISEGKVTVFQKRIRLLQKLTERGIINSISSKNDEETVRKVLREHRIEDLFVFNHINWENKGSQIKQKIKDMGLREENVLFIDDAQRNLEEATYYCPGLMTALPDIIPYLERYVDRTQVTDASYERLQQYRILETKKRAREKYISNEQFLLDSRITISICHNCMQEIERISELVNRTNQLNYTKQRCDKQELVRQISDDWMDAAYVTLADKFGSYGVVGFYCYDKRQMKMEHFLFSCRTMGIRLEQYIYQRLGCPAFETVNPVASQLSSYENIFWIRETPSEQMAGSLKPDNRVRILLKGPCDLSAIEPYLIGGKITTEFNYVNEKGVTVAGQNHSMHIWQSRHLSDVQKQEMISRVPFLCKGDFDTLLFEKTYHIICYSLLPDCHAGLYRNKEKGYYISFGSVNFDLTDSRNWSDYCKGRLVDHGFYFTEECLQTFAKEWEFVGTTKTEDLIRNLDDMYTSVPGKPVFVLLLGSEEECEIPNAEFADHATRHRIVNQVVTQYAEGKERIKLIRMTDLIHSQQDYEGCINHFSRRVYYDLATEIVRCINESV